MKKQGKVLLTTLSLALALGTTSGITSFAKESNKKQSINTTLQQHPVKILNTSIVNIHNEKFKTVLTDNGNSITTSVTNNKGTIWYTKNKTTNLISVSSNFLTNSELKSVQLQVNSIVKEINSSKSKSASVKSASITDWNYGSWSKYKITDNGRFVAQTLIGILGSAFGFGGVAVAGIANIAIQYAVHTGYYRVKVDTRILNANYMEEKTTVELYSDSQYKHFVGRTTQDEKVWIGV